MAVLALQLVWTVDKRKTVNRNDIVNNNNNHHHQKTTTITALTTKYNEKRVENSPKAKEPM